ncbi:hypothetical protein IQ264_02940 [Phormidium sp. LEGE 05292]|uniref:hypothetical protein n=1 Tax=[Phormidium] sp. LEGE 05292 TaxID=767427 RepID=UPI00187FA062|nr:hypothetical protein [Phormidium sp. LEGE 05292]MBE9224430.1 hypothetical protein [Phormidium sp. LEGE 05292]
MGHGWEFLTQRSTSLLKALNAEMVHNLGLPSEGFWFYESSKDGYRKIENPQPKAGYLNLIPNFTTTAKLEWR